MVDHQCGLCLSCGSPFLPGIEDVDFFNREANLSMMFLNTLYKQDPEVQRVYDHPKLCSTRQASHMFHVSYHATALDYMCNRHQRDRDVGMPVPGANALIQDMPNAPLLFYHTATGNAGASVACWNRPGRNERVDLSPLFRFVQRVRNPYRVPRTLAQTFDMCVGCNSLMTQKSHFRFLLGLRGAGAKNQQGVLLRRNVITRSNADPRRTDVSGGYGVWQVANNPRVLQMPNNHKQDSETPAIAYYLHMCLPYQVNRNGDAFQNVPRNARRSVRALYLKLCWIVLEIACLGSLLLEGTKTKRGSKRSHGLHQHRGVLDVYVSYFFWHLALLQNGHQVGRPGLSRKPVLTCCAGDTGGAGFRPVAPKVLL